MVAKGIQQDFFAGRVVLSVLWLVVFCCPSISANQKACTAGKSEQRMRGMRRTEHMVHLRKPAAKKQKEPSIAFRAARCCWRIPFFRFVLN